MEETSIMTLVSGISSAVWMINYLLYYSDFVQNSAAAGLQDALFSVASFSASVYAVCKIAEGIINTSFLSVNAGLIAGFINLQIWFAVISPDTFLFGISMLLFGAALITVNAGMAYRIKQIKSSESEEAAENEEK